MSTLTFRGSEEEADGEESLLPRALEVPSGGSEDEQEDGQLPSSALRYLRFVRREQAKQNEVVTADLAKLRIKTDSPRKQLSSAPEEAVTTLSLSRRWQESAEAEFSSLRCRLARWKARHAAELRRRAATLPSAGDDRSAWLAVCSPEAEGATGPAGLAPPSLHTVGACTQLQLRCLLDHLLHWTGRRGLGEGRASWLFAVLAALEKPLPADTCSALRETARLCRDQRDKLKRDDPRLAAACLLVCLVGRYFGQTDLADPWR